jgi:ferric-dicitrate binding protein FerR (iron transport regulator)
MNEEMTYYIDLISRYFSGEASPGEIQSLTEWVKENEENRGVFKKYQQAWNLTEQQIIEKNTDLDAEWASLTSKISFEKQQEARIVSINRETKRGSFHWGKVAAASILIVALAAVGYFMLRTPSLITVTAEAGALVKTLPDGSVITLNKGAILEYPSKFSGARNVKLSGEGYFEVAHDADHPFIVSSGIAKIEVLGTRFNVRTDTEGGKVSVVLTSGKVSVYHADNVHNRTILNPGEQAEISDMRKEIVKSKVTDQNYMSWKTGRIVFDNTPLLQIASVLESVYHTRVILTDPALVNCRVTATFEHQSITSVLLVLKNTLDLQIREKDGKFLISGKGC